MKVWILQTGEPLHCDGGNPRPMRAMNLADALVAKGHDVVIWSSAFYHQDKRSRTAYYQEIEVSKGLLIRLVPSPGYSRNIGIGRLYDHFRLGKNLSRILKSFSSDHPDVIFVGFPPIEAASVMVSFAHARAVPVVLDAKDQWPEIFLEVLPKFLWPLGRLVLYRYFLERRRIFSRATAFCSMSDEFIDWMCVVADRERRPVDCSAPLTAAPREFSDAELGSAKRWWREQGVDLETKKRAVFIGSFSSAFDFYVIFLLAEMALANNNPCQFVICGEGGDSSAVRALFRGCRNVVVSGWIDSPKIKVLYESSSAMIAPYRPNDAFSRSIPNKIMDALCYGCAIISTLDGKTRSLVSSSRIGRCSDDIKALYVELAQLIDDDAYRSSVSARCRDLYQTHFNFDVVYGALVDRLVRIASDNNQSG